MGAAVQQQQHAQRAYRRKIQLQLLQACQYLVSGRYYFIENKGDDQPGQNPTVPE